MPAPVLDALGVLAQALEIAGAAALLLGFLRATFCFVRSIGRPEPVIAYDAYRASIGRSVVVGLEIFVAATIIKTITVEPTLESLGVLALMIAVRTCLSWTMALEITGRWPWQRTPAQSAPSAAAEASADPRPPRPAP